MLGKKSIFDSDDVGCYERGWAAHTGKASVVISAFVCGQRKQCIRRFSCRRLEVAADPWLNYSRSPSRAAKPIPRASL
jgi:hypothetical protein